MACLHGFFKLVARYAVPNRTETGFFWKTCNRPGRDFCTSSHLGDCLVRLQIEDPGEDATQRRVGDVHGCGDVLPAGSPEGMRRSPLIPRPNCVTRNSRVGNRWETGST